MIYLCLTFFTLQKPDMLTGVCVDFSYPLYVLYLVEECKTKSCTAFVNCIVLFQIDLKKVGNIEGDIISCLVIMVMKLSETTFRPLFFKVNFKYCRTYLLTTVFFAIIYIFIYLFYQLFDWSRTEGASKERLITFYRLADCIAGKLKGLFTLFAGHLLKPLAEILNQTNAMKTGIWWYDKILTTTMS